MRTRTEAGRRPARLIGVGMAGLVQGACQPRGLFSGVVDEKKEKIERTADAIREKLGSEAIQRASVKFGQDNH